MQGKVEWYTPVRGFGILSAVGADGGLDKYYFHVTKILKSPEKIKQGQQAQFEINPDPPRPGNLPMAMNIVITEPASVAAPQNGGAA